MIEYIILAVFIISTFVFVALFVVMLYKYKNKNTISSETCKVLQEDMPKVLQEDLYTKVFQEDMPINNILGFGYLPKDVRSETIINLLKQLFGKMQVKFCDKPYQEYILKKISDMNARQKNDTCTVIGMMATESIPEITKAISTPPANILSQQEKFEVCRDPSTLAYFLFKYEIISNEEIDYVEKKIKSLDQIHKDLMCENVNNVTQMMEIYNMPKEITVELFTEQSDIESILEQIYQELCKEGTSLEEFKGILSNMITSFC